MLLWNCLAWLLVFPDETTTSNGRGSVARGELSLNDFGNVGMSLEEGIAHAARMPSKSSSERSNLTALECPLKSTMGKPYRSNLK